MLNDKEKLNIVREIIRSLDNALVAYSGGVDSTFLLKVCREVLGEKVLAVTAKSPLHPSGEINGAVEMARSLAVKHLVIESREMDNPDFVVNPPERCYYCKIELFNRLKGVARDEGFNNIVDGSNYDDLSDYRPGSRAAAEFGVRHPLQEAGLTKENIRVLSKELGLSTWDKPSQACLASRFPYGTSITRESLRRVGEAEGFLRSLGIRQLRVRHYNETARIEVESGDMRLLLEEGNRHYILTRFRELGYLHITLDLAGYRSGSMNEGLNV